LKGIKMGKPKDKKEKPQKKMVMIMNEKGKKRIVEE